MIDQDISDVWKTKIREADDYYASWEKRYNIRALEDYEEGFQVAEDVEAYVLNLFFATIEVKSPQLAFTRPIFDLKPSASTIREFGDATYEISSNLQNTINTFVLDERNNFHQEVLSAIDDSWSRFGIVEIGYSASWIDNPKIQLPKQESDYIPGVDKRRLRNARNQPDKIPQDEQIYCINIPAERFRVSSIDAAELWQCDWCGYYDYVRVEDLLSIPGLRNKEELRRRASKESSETDTEEQRQIDFAGSLDIVKVWKIWDLRSKEKMCFSGDVLFWKKPFKIFPFVDLRFKRRKKVKGFFPLPLTFNWLSPQNEINEVRNAHRNHRRRFKRIYWANKNAFDDQMEEEIQNQFINGPDGVLIFANRDNPIGAVPNADLGVSANLSMQVTLDDFNRITGTTSEMRGESDRTTATQAALSNERARVRESKERSIVAEFIQRVGKKILSFHQEMLVNPYSVFDVSQGNLLDNYQETPSIIEIDPIIDLGDEKFDYAIMLKVSTISVTAAEDDKRSLIEFLTLLNQFPQFGLSPTLIQELAFKVGYTNEKVLKEFQQLAQLQMVGLLQQAGAAIAGQGNQQQQLAQMTPPTQEEIRNQIKQQGVPL